MAEETVKKGRVRGKEKVLIPKALVFGFWWDLPSLVCFAEISPWQIIS